MLPVMLLASSNAACSISFLYCFYQKKRGEGAKSGDVQIKAMLSFKLVVFG